MSHLIGPQNHPRKRQESLFWVYYQTICRREQGKGGGFGNLIRTHEPQILDLHEREQ